MLYCSVMLYFYHNAILSYGAILHHNSILHHDAILHHHAILHHNAILYHDTLLHHNGLLNHDAILHHDAIMTGHEEPQWNQLAIPGFVRTHMVTRHIGQHACLLTLGVNLLSGSMPWQNVLI